jgi:hypothetical protein
MDDTFQVEDERFTSTQIVLRSSSTWAEAIGTSLIGLFLLWALAWSIAYPERVTYSPDTTWARWSVWTLVPLFAFVALSTGFRRRLVTIHLSRATVSVRWRWGILAGHRHYLLRDFTAVRLARDNDDGPFIALRGKRNVELLGNRSLTELRQIADRVAQATHLPVVDECNPNT